MTGFQWWPLVVGGLVGWAIQALINVAGFSASRTWEALISHFRPSIRCHLGLYDLYRLDHNGILFKAHLKLHRSMIRGGLRFRLAFPTKTIPDFTGVLKFSGHYLVITSHDPEFPYMAVFHAQGNDLDDLKVGVFAGIRKRDSAAYAGRVLISKESCRLTESCAKRILQGDTITVISSSVLERALNEFRSDMA